MDISSIGLIFKGLKTAKEVSDKINNAELTNIIADLMMNSADLKMEMVNLKSENQELIQKLSEKEKYNMVFENGIYWDVKSDGKKDGPFCPTCWENKTKRISLHSTFFGCVSDENPYLTDNAYICKVCNNSFDKKD